LETCGHSKTPFYEKQLVTRGQIKCPSHIHHISYMSILPEITLGLTLYVSDR